MSGKGKPVKKHEEHDEEKQPVKTWNLMTVFRQDKLLAVERDEEGAIYIRARRREGEAQWDTIPFKLSEQEAALLAVKLFFAVGGGRDA
jgi:hypothetical protein